MNAYDAAMPRPPKHNARTFRAPTGRAIRNSQGLNIIFEDDHVLVVDKPAGLLTADATKAGLEDLFGMVKSHVRENARRRGTQVWIIHRLDREASGLLVFAKTDDAFKSLKDQFRSKVAGRIYLAVCRGAWAKPDGSAIVGTVRSMLTEDAMGNMHSAPEVISRKRQGDWDEDFEDERDERDDREEDDDRKDRGQRSHRRDRDDGERGQNAKLAITHYRVMASGKGRSLVQVRLETGRKHQIRVHLGSLGHGIVGDHKYGQDPAAMPEHPNQRLCLHGVELQFIHPATGQKAKFHSPAPHHFHELVGMYHAPEVKSMDDIASEVAAATTKPAKVDKAAAKAAAVAKVAASKDAAFHAAKTAESKFAAAKSAANPADAPQDSSWNHVAEWYDELLTDRVSDHHENVVMPATIELLGRIDGKRILDVACGQGILCRRFARLGAEVVGVDLARGLIDHAKKAGGPIEYHVGDARDLESLKLGEFDAATCVLALMNINPLVPALKSVSNCLKAGGTFVSIILHPAFRNPGNTSWGWAAATPKRTTQTRTPVSRQEVQYRRVDAYLSQTHKDIVMNPGAVSSGAKEVTTTTYHRPISAYVADFARSGFAITALEELTSSRVSQPGPRASEENRARREFPMFLAIRAVKL